jgi:hypothetical protein
LRIGFKRLGVDEYDINDCLGIMTATTLESTSSDRERIRMELWNSAYLHFIKTHVHSLAAEMATTALAAFDKQFPK